MAQSGFLQLNNNDDLSKVIRKCNTNFRALATQKQQQDRINAQSADETSAAIGEALSDIVTAIEDEAEFRRDADGDLQNAIDGLATVASTGDYNDLINTPTIPTGEHVIPFGTVDSTSTSTVMTATVPGLSQLKDGVAAYIMNGVVTSASGFTLNVNGLGALPVYSSMAAASRSTTIFNVNYTMLFVYNSQRVAGGCWDVFYGYDSNTNTIGYQVRTNSMSLPMSSVVYRYRLLFTSADGTKFVPANNSSSTNATAARTVCQDPIDPFGNIVYYGTTASVAAGSRPGAAYLWRIYTLTLGYSFNRTGAALTLTSWKPVYIKCAPQNDGSAIIDSDNPFVQDLPATEDGKIYIYLGIAYSATAVELTDNHPVYYYHNGSIRLWTDPKSFATVAMSGDHDDLVNNPVALTNMEIEALLT